MNARHLAVYAQAAATAGDEENAERAFRLALRTGRTDPFVLELFACHAARRGRLKEAYRALKRATDKGGCSTWVNLALVARARGDIEGAIAALEQAVRLDPSYATPAGTRARVIAIELCSALSGDRS